jgi:transcriptional regulator NrdR family protein
MKCPNCNNTSSPKEVLRTWQVKNGSVKRKRKCMHCKSIFNTIELILIREKVVLDGVQA